MDDMGQPDDFALTVDWRAKPAVLTVRYPNRPGRIPVISGLSISLVGGTMDDTCELSAKHLDGKLISGLWALGTEPPNYTLEHCHFATFRPGEYEIALFTDRGEFARRLRVTASGRAVVMPWERPGLQ
jgi:hypothetical protein